MVNGKAFAENQVLSFMDSQWKATFNDKGEFKSSKHFLNNSNEECKYAGLSLWRFFSGTCKGADYGLEKIFN